MKQTLLGLLVVVTTTSLGGCIFVSKKPAHREHREQASERRCKPSQHWEDGHCVHNGRGKGARKHDD